MTESKRSPQLLVLGLGNVLCGDDGLGVAAVEMLRRRYDFPGNVEVLDGGTLGLSLLSYVSDADDVILVDAIRAEGPAGSHVRLNGDDVAPAVEARLSVHQVGVADLLDALRWLGALPRRLVLLGLVPESLRLKLGRSPAIERQIPSLVERVVEEANSMGYPFRRKTKDETAAADRLGSASRALGL